MKRKQCFLVTLIISTAFTSWCICATNGTPEGVGAIEGQVEKRKVVHWPKLPESLQQMKYGMVIRFTVKQRGDVFRVEVKKTSGSAELDKVAMAYVKQIRFEPSFLIGQGGQIIIPDKPLMSPKQKLENKLKGLQLDLDDKIGELKILKLEVKNLEEFFVTVKRENEGLKTTNKGLRVENRELEAENRELKAENKELKADNMRLKRHGAKSQQVDSFVIASWTGSGIIERTSSFRVNKVPWTIVWSSFPNADTNKRTSTLNVSVHEQNGDLVNIAVDNLNYGSGLVHVNKTGTFYLSISSLFTNWRVRVLEDK